MYAKITFVQFKTEAIEEATRIFRDIMMPSASIQKGFKHGMAFQSATQAEKHVIISVWETESDLLESKPPEHLLPQFEPLEEYITEISQDRYELLFQIEGKQPDEPMGRQR